MQKLPETSSSEKHLCSVTYYFYKMDFNSADAYSYDSLTKQGSHNFLFGNVDV